jgi:transposase
MNSGRTVFAQLVEFLPVHEFRKCVDRYRGEYKVQKFTCLDQFLCMAFAQLTFRESLRDIETCLRAVRGKLYHMGIRGGISRTTLAKANENRDWRIFADFAQVLIRTARALYANDPFAVELEQTVYSPRLHDDRPVSLPVSVGTIPETEGGRQTPHPVGSAGEHPLVHQDHRREVARRQCPGRTGPEPGSYYVMDRGYLDFERLHAFSDCSAFFVIRAKKNLCYRRLYSTPVDKTTRVRFDQTIVLTGVNTAEHYPDKPRRIRYVDAETRRNLVFLSNDFSLPPESIALLYKQRWQVELFFRWIKQHLRIKAFFGTSENVVKTQVWIAISVYVLVAIIKKRLNLDLSLYTILQILSIAVFEKEPIIQIVANSAHQDLCPEPDNQLKLFK